MSEPTTLDPQADAGERLDAFISLDAQGRVREWNAAAERMFGWSLRQAEGQVLSDLVAPARLRALYEHEFERVRDSGAGPGGARQLEVAAVRRDGRELPVDLRFFAVDTVGGPKYHADISARRTDPADPGLIAVLDTSSDAIVSVDLEGVIEAWSEGAQRMYGHRADDMLGQSIDRLRGEESTPRFAQLAARIQSGKSLPNVELRQRTRDAGAIDVSLSVLPLRDSGGEIVGATLVARDITGPKQIAEELHEQRERNRLAFVNAPIGMALVGVGGRILAANKALGKLLGRDEQELLSLDVQTITHPDDLAGDAGLVAKLVAGDINSYQMEKRFLRPDGSIVWGLLATSLVRDAERNPSYVVSQIVDITDRKAEEERLRLLANRLDRLAARAAGTNTQLTDALGRDASTNRTFLDDEAELNIGHERIRRLVRRAREELEMECAYVGRITDGHQIFEVIDGDGESFSIHEGDAVPLDETICHRMLSGELPPVVPDSREVPPLQELATAHSIAIGSYAGVPVRDGSGELIGTLCLVSHEPRPALAQQAPGLLRLLSDVTTDTLERIDVEDQRRRAEVELAGVRALAAALDARDHLTGDHSRRVVELAIEVAKRLGLIGPQLDAIAQVALLHDIGKVAIPDAVLQKQGELSASEWGLMRQHPAIGERIVASTATLAHLAPAIRAEHERYDGRGYPDGLSGDEIPIASRIVLASDAWHAMTTDRPYRNALTPAEARRELRSNAGGQFDPAVVRVLLEALDEDGSQDGAQDGSARRREA